MKTNPWNEIKVNIDAGVKEKAETRIVEKQKLFLKDTSKESFFFFRVSFDNNLTTF
jgi:hypothetical protein